MHTKPKNTTVYDLFLIMVENSNYFSMICADTVRDEVQLDTFSRIQTVIESGPTIIRIHRCAGELDTSCH